MSENDKYFYVELDGKKVRYEIIKVILPDNGKYKYVIYTEDGKSVYASRFKLKNNNVILEDIKYQYEFDMIDRIMEEN